MSATRHVDVAIVGAGTAGMAAYRAARAHTDRLLLIDEGPGGTTCARVGCMPSKLLIAAADAAHAAREAHAVGVNVDAVRVDGAAVMARVRRERDRFVRLVHETVAGWPEAHRLHGQAQRVGPQTLEVDGVTVHAERIVWATGARAHVEPAWRAALGERLITSDDVFDWQALPGSVAVIGTGTIALELGQALNRLGVRVRLFARHARVGPLTDPALQRAAFAHFSSVLPIAVQDAALAFTRESDGARVSGCDEPFEWVLAATGRPPRDDEFDVAQWNPETAQLGDSPVFVAGDVSGHRPLLHEAADAGRIAGDNAGRWPDVQAHPRRTPLGIVFTDPQMAVVGQSHRALTEAGAAFATGRVDFAGQGRSRIQRQNVGALQVYGERATGRLLGAELFGPAGEHLAHLLAWAVQRGDTVQDALACPFYHPVVEEGLRTALRDLHTQINMK